MLVEIINFVFSPLFYLFEPYISRVTNVLTSQKTQRTAIKTIFISGAAIVLISIAFVAYLSFYMIYVPKIAHAKPIYLQYDKGTSPYAIVDFTDNGRYDKFLTADQAYDILIDLDVPSSDRNVALGNFMVGLDLMAKNETVQSSSRPCILTYQSGLFRVVYTFWRMVPLVLGFTKEDQQLRIVMFENMIESAQKPVTQALITISNSNLEVYSAYIRLDAHFRGLRYLMYYHSVPTAIVFMFMFLTWEILFSAIAWRLFVSWWQDKVMASTQKTPITFGVNGTNNMIDNRRDGDSDRTFGRRIDRIERNTDDNGTVTESDSESEMSRPVSVISPTDAALVSESGEMGYSNTEESYTTEDDETHSFISRDEDSSSIIASETDVPTDDNETEGSATPTSRSRRSTISEVSTTNMSEYEDGPSATSTSRLQSDYTTPVRRTGFNGGNNENNRE